VKEAPNVGLDWFISQDHNNEINVNSGDDFFEGEPEEITVCANCMGWGVDGNPWA
jgi:hypothetical protein